MQKLESDRECYVQYWYAVCVCVFVCVCVNRRVFVRIPTERHKKNSFENNVRK